VSATRILTLAMIIGSEESFAANGGRALTYAQAYQRGIKDFIAGVPLVNNPYNRLDCVETSDAWSAGWHEASHARWRSHAQKHVEHSPPHRIAIKDAPVGGSSSEATKAN
jgi:ribosome modulation factor